MAQRLLLLFALLLVIFGFATAQQDERPLLYFADFEDMRLPPQLQVVGGEPTLAGGSLILSGTGTQLVSFASSPAWTDYALEMDIRITSGQVRLGARASGEGLCAGYFFSASAARGRYELARGTRSCGVLLYSAQNASIPLDATLTLGIEVEGDAIRTTVYGETLLSVRDDAYTSGPPIIAVIAEDEPSRVAIEAIRVVALGESVMALTQTSEPPFTPSLTATNTATPTTIATVTPAPTDTVAPTNTPMPTVTAMPMDTAMPTDTPMPTVTAMPTATPMPTDTPAPTDTVAPTVTPMPTNTPAPTDTPMPTATPLTTLANYADGPEAALAELQAGGLVTEGGTMQFEQDFAAINRVGNWFVSLEGVGSNVVVAGELTLYNASGGRAQNCALSLRVRKLRNGTAVTYVDVGINSRGEVYISDTFYRGQAPIYSDFQNLRLASGQAVHILAVAVGEELTVFVDGERVFDRAPVWERIGAFGFTMESGGPGARCELRNAWGYRFD